MKYTFIMTGRLKETYQKAAVDDYMQKIKPYATVEVLYFEETAYKKDPSAATVKASLDEEAKKILAKIGRSDKVILVDLHGKVFSSEKLAESIDAMKSHGAGHIYVIIGSSYGLSDLLRNRADLSLKLSDLTFPHPLALLLSMEQIYRTEMILAHMTYHK